MGYLINVVNSIVYSVEKGKNKVVFDVIFFGEYWVYIVISYVIFFVVYIYFIWRFKMFMYVIILRVI